jgi:hypothetical protein
MKIGKVRGGTLPTTLPFICSPFKFLKGLGNEKDFSFKRSVIY